jgi:hypothetical protein
MTKSDIAGIVPFFIVKDVPAALGRSYLVEMPDEAHDARPSACHAAIVAQFLEDPTRKPDTSCLASLPPIPFTTTWTRD